ncbi:Uncharacterized protein APZ42_014357 [Daphnia magna]|uniref:Uncharacterized protein n=1 Tax=Daphnia magna TaxID=35525 RepID=A0A162Q7M2_9CRUS|nr:Uncharacterized protein APZ42_014357 [Daphnia magna]
MKLDENCLQRLSLASQKTEKEQQQPSAVRSDLCFTNLRLDRKSSKPERKKQRKHNNNIHHNRLPLFFTLVSFCCCGPNLQN